MFQRKCFPVIFAVALPFFWIATASGQDEEPGGVDPPGFAVPQIPIGFDQVAPVSPEHQLEVARKAHSQDVQRRLAIRIGELQRVCNLSEQQVKRLQLAAKGAVRRDLRGFKQKFEAAQLRMMNGVIEGQLIELEVNGVPAKPPTLTGASPQDAKETDSQKPPQDKEVAALLREVGTLYGTVGLSSDIEKQRFWLTTLRKTLTEEQQTKHQQHVVSRTAYRRRATVSHVVSGMDEKLLLSDPQRKKLTKVVDTELGKFFEVLPHQQATYILESLQHLRATQPAYSRLRKKAKAFLTAAQMEQFVRLPQADDAMFFGMVGDFLPPEPAVEIPEGAGYLGVQLVEGPGGVELLAVTENLAADKAGLETGDTITSFDGKDVSTVRELVELVAGSKAGQKVNVSIQREDETLKIEVELGERQ
jgi:hypothetical protein